MALTPATIYPFDPTGTNPNNLIVDEIHTLEDTPVRMIVPDYGPFYKKSVVVWDHSTGEQLYPEKHYQFAELHRDLTMKLGLEVYQLILITDPAVSHQARIRYQCVGGEFTYPAPGIVKLYNYLINDPRPVDWVNVLNKPRVYPPSLHTHIMADIYSFQALVDALERVRNAIIMCDIPVINRLVEYLDDRMVQYPKDNFILLPEKDYLYEGNALRFDLISRLLYQKTPFFWDIEHITTTNSMFVNLAGWVKIRGDRAEDYIQTKKVFLDESKSFKIRLWADGPNSILAYETPEITIYPVN